MLAVQSYNYCLMATVIIENTKGHRAPTKAKVIVENEPVKYKRPCTLDSGLFFGDDGKLYVGYYLTTNKNIALEYFRYFEEINNQI